MSGTFFNLTNKITDSPEIKNLYDSFAAFYQPPPQALRFWHSRGELETRVTGDEPQGNVGRVQTAGEAPDISPVVSFPSSFARTFLSIERRLGTRQAFYCMKCSCKKWTKFHRRQIGNNVWRFNFFTATVIAPGIPFNPVALAFPTSPNEPLPRMFCRSICFENTSQRDGVTERYLLILFEPFTLLRKNKKLIVGFHMTSLKFKLQNYRSYWDFTFMVY